MSSQDEPSAPWADERLAATFLAWWERETVELDDDMTEEQGAMDDFRSLVRHLSANGYEVVRRG